ncbi:MAG TPA: TIR domain-containing protein, partial [Kofleriaceae bacterium]
MAGARQEPTLPSVFLSYARADDEDGFVREVYDTLRNRGFTVWWDQVSMPSRALTFLPEIAEAIDASDRLLLVLSPTAVQSEYVRAEWQYALVKDKVVTPVLRRGGFELLPSELEATSCGDARASREKDKALEAIVRLASYPPPPLASAASVPVPPPCYRPRSDPFARVAGRLGLEEPKRLAVPEEERTVLVHGMGGVGKSVLAAAVARSAMIRRVFSDGVIWVAVGRDAQPLAVLQQIALRLGDDLAKYATEAAARQQLAVRLD